MVTAEAETQVLTAAAYLDSIKPSVERVADWIAPEGPARRIGHGSRRGR